MFKTSKKIKELKAKIEFLEEVVFENVMGDIKNTVEETLKTHRELLTQLTKTSNETVKALALLKDVHEVTLNQHKQSIETLDAYIGNHKEAIEALTESLITTSNKVVEVSDNVKYSTIIYMNLIKALKDSGVIKDIEETPWLN